MSSGTEAERYESCPGLTTHGCSYEAIVPRLILSMTAILFLAGTSVAECQSSSISIANGLGQMLGSEEECGFHFNSGAVKEFINNEVDDSDLNFNKDMQFYSGTTKARMQSLSNTEKISWCEQVRRLAKRFKFIE